MFRLHRPDVLPVGDLGIVKAVQRAYKLRTLPTPARLTKIGETWRPYRSVACWYLWASLDNPPLKTSKNGAVNPADMYSTMPDIYIMLNKSYVSILVVLVVALLA